MNLTHPLRLSRRPLTLGLSLLAAALLAACSPPPVAEEPVRAVKVMTVGAAAFESTHEFAAEVRHRV